MALPATQTFCICFSGRAESGGARRTGRSGRNNLRQINQDFSVYLHYFDFFGPSGILGTAYFYHHTGRISLETAPKERGRNKKRVLERSAPRRRLVCARRGERVASCRLCVFARWRPRTELDSAVVLPRRTTKREGAGGR